MEKKFKTGDLVLLISDINQVPMTVRQYVCDIPDSMFLPKEKVDGFVVCDWRDTENKPQVK